MTHLPHDHDHGTASPELLEIMERMKARYLATGQVNAPEGSPEAKSPNKRWWHAFWLSQPPRDQPPR